MSSAGALHHPADAPGSTKVRPRRTASPIIFNEGGKLLVGRRSNRKKNCVGQWQFIQGGINVGEDIRVATLREIEEEVGLRSPPLSIVHLLPEPIITPSEGPPKSAMYVSIVFWPSADLSQCKLDNEAHPEFTELKFSDWASFLTECVEFKRPLYERIRTLVEPMITQFLNTHHQNNKL